MLALLCDALAAARLTRLAHRDTLLDPAREAVVRRLPAADELLSCPWCLSIWAGLAVVAARRLAPRAWAPLSAALACSQVAGMVDARS